MNKPPPPPLRVVQGGRSDGRPGERSAAAPPARPQRHIVGDLLRFDHGTYYAGWDNREIAHGTELLALLPSLRCGWLRWDHGRCVDQITGRVADRPPRQSRPKGEWVAIHQLALIDLIDGADLYVFKQHLGRRNRNQEVVWGIRPTPARRAARAARRRDWYGLLRPPHARPDLDAHPRNRRLAVNMHAPKQSEALWATSGKLTTLRRDYETLSTIDLPAVGAWRYATHPTTDLRCGAYAVDDGPIKLWVPGDPVPAEFIEAARNPDWLVSAFNDQFERLIEQFILGPRYGWPLVPIERHRCSQAAALALALPADLGKVARALALTHQKDAAGHKVMLQLSKPRRPRKDEDPAGVYWHNDPERLAILYRYVKQDVAVERELDHRIGPLSPELQSEWLLDAVINERGTYLDGTLLDAAINISEAAQREINAELQEITGGELKSINQQQIKEWLGERGCDVADIQKVTMLKALERANISPAARRVIELRIDGAHAAPAKLETMRDWRNADGRARGTFRFHGASTGRWTSFGIQTQNLKRPVVEDLGAAIEAVATGDLNHMRQLYAQPMSVVGDTARAIFRASPGHRLITGDFSGVESRITAWVSGQQSKLDLSGPNLTARRTRRMSPTSFSGASLDCTGGKQGRSGKRRTWRSAIWARRAPGGNWLLPMTHQHRQRSSNAN